ncbi:hypothetical protein Mapa_001006 [Marchantia paleacea]|nr:hypothetical protein Mapa_001006 [Marchantia paleacea]
MKAARNIRGTHYTCNCFGGEYFVETVLVGARDQFHQMAWRTEYLDLILSPLAFALMIVYNVRLYNRFNKSPDSTVMGVNHRARRAWVRAIMQVMILNSLLAMVISSYHSVHNCSCVSELQQLEGLQTWNVISRTRFQGPAVETSVSTADCICAWILSGFPLFRVLSGGVLSFEDTMDFVAWLLTPAIADSSVSQVQLLLGHKGLIRI